MRRRRTNKSREMNSELNITAFMNLMVVLVPFLLITAVFSQVSILKLNLPEGAVSAAKPEKDPPKALEVIIRSDHFDVMERNSGLLKRVKNKGGQPDFMGLNTFLQQIKAHSEFNTDTGVTLLMEMETEYDVLVQTMDAVRLVVLDDVALDKVELDDRGNVIQGELFPNISMGDAPDESNVPSGSQNSKQGNQ